MDTTLNKVMVAFLISAAGCLLSVFLDSAIQYFHSDMINKSMGTNDRQNGQCQDKHVYVNVEH